MKFYVLVYDRDQQRVLSHREYAESMSAEALGERDRFVLRERERPNVEVVLLVADSYEGLRRTHSRYFKLEAVEEIARSST